MMVAPCFVIFGDRMEELDDWRDCKITRAEQIRDLFVPNFFSAARATTAQPRPRSIAG